MSVCCCVVKIEARNRTSQTSSGESSSTQNDGAPSNAGQRSLKASGEETSFASGVIPWIAAATNRRQRLSSRWCLPWPMKNPHPRYGREKYPRIDRVPYGLSTGELERSSLSDESHRK
jgi:hypothetical protein